MILGDLGAEIIKIEEPIKGDDTRTWGPPFANSPKGSTATQRESAYFLGVNRNKKSVCVNLKEKEGIKIIKDLAKVSDVVVENYLPGKLDRMGLGYDDLSRVNEGLIYASITGYGPDGPYAKRPGYDVIIEAEAGLMHITGEESGDPVKVGVAITDLTTGLYAHGAILAALFARNKTGKGQKIDVSLLESQIASLANIGSSYLIAGKEATRHGTSHASIVPYQRFKTKDGSIVFGAGNDAQFRHVCKVLRLPENDPKFATNEKRVENRQELVRILQDELIKWEASEILNELHKVGIPSGPVNNIAQTFAHPQVLHRRMIETVTHPTLGDIKLVGVPVSYSQTPARIKSPPPTHGQHTNEVLTEILGYSKQEIEKLGANHVIRNPT